MSGGEADPTAAARAIVEGARSGALCTCALDPAGHPFGSLVVYALVDGEPVFLISELAEHTRNLRKDPRASLLVVEPGGEGELDRGRVTLVGHGQPIAEPEAVPPVRKAFLAAHPDAARYVDFGDFAFWRLEVDSVRYVGGLGRMTWIDREAWHG